MISIIVCSQDKELRDQLKTNISDTINVPFQFVAINNEDGQMGICRAYNEGAAKAKYDVLCFMHEDVSFETFDWGSKVIKHLQDDEIGLIGVAGGDTKSWVPSSWSSFIFPSEISLVQHFKRDERRAERIIRTGYRNNRSASKRVACIDGVWMCTRREVFDKFKFDQQTFTGFHGYDIDYSLQISTRYKICVVFDVLLHHYSEGSFNKLWMENAIKVSDKWRKRLPSSVRDIPKTEFVHQHWTSMRNFLNKLIDLEYSLIFILYCYTKYSFTRYFHWKHFLHFLKHIILRKTGLKKIYPKNLQLAEQAANN